MSHPLIVIGASAGGLDPLEAFFTAAPVDAGWSFIVVQHLSPDYRSMMDELLGRRSRLAIRHAEDGAVIEPDTIYLNPPNTLLTVEDDRIRLAPFDPQETPNLPIDALFFSLAAASRASLYAVVLSGSGSDGANGAQAVRNAGGRVLVQAPEEAKFDSMPRSVIAAGAANRILPAASIPAEIEALLQYEGDAGTARETPLPADPHMAILVLLERSHGIDFSHYKKATVFRRIDRRLALKELPDAAAYRDLLQDDPAALEELYQDLLIGVTDFCRDPEAFEVLERFALPRLATEGDPSREIRIWVPGCATGEEAYSIAMLLAQVLERSGSSRSFKIIATDVHRRSVDRAAVGIFTAERARKLPEHLRERYLAPFGEDFQVVPDLRRNLLFSVHDVLKDPPFMRLDLVSCRNLLIYLDEGAQERVLGLFGFALRKDGFLFLGSSESLGAYEADFATVDARWRLFRKRVERRQPADVTFVPRSVRHSRSEERGERAARPPLAALESERARRKDRAMLLRSYDALLKRYAPSSILIGADGEVLTWFGEAGDYIDTMSDLAERTVEELVVEPLRYVINVGTERLRRNQEERFERDVEVTREDGLRRLAVSMEALVGQGENQRYLLVRIDRLEPPGDSEGDGATPPARRTRGDDGESDEAFLVKRIGELERDLRSTEESLQYVTERLETSGEELQTSNEELQASNEELQASNEELQSSNEELHAVNEELVQVSTEHQRKIEQLTRLYEDTEFVFDELDLAVVIVSNEMTLGRFTHRAAELFGLMPQDVGRSLSSLDLTLDTADPRTMARTAISERKALSATGRRGKSALHVKAIPREADGDNINAEKGVVLIFTPADDGSNDAKPAEGTEARGEDPGR